MSTAVTFRLAGKQTPLIRVPTFVNGRGPFEFLLDTGASHCLLSQEIAHQFNLVGGQASEALDAGGTLQVVEGRVAQLSVGATTRKDMVVGIADLQPLSQTLGTPISGNLGFTFFTGLRLTIDYPTGTLDLSEGHQVEARKHTGPPIPFKATPLLLVSVMVNGQGPYDFVLDTGASATLLSPELAERLGLTPTEGASVRGAVTLGRGGRCVLESLALGAAEQHHLPVVIADIFGPLAQKVGARLDGVLGYDVLKAYRVTLNYVEQTLLLQQDAEERI